MSEKVDDNTLVLHLSGLDKPGVTSNLLSILGEENAELVDIGQAVLHGYLSLSAIVRFKAGSDALRKILFSASKLGMKLEVAPFTDAQSMAAKKNDSTSPLCVTILGALETASAISNLTQFIASRDMNILDIKTLSEGRLYGMELQILPARTTDAFENRSLLALRQDLWSLAGKLGVDLAVQREDLFRRNKRLVLMDVDSTFIQMEVIDELARLAGCMEKVSKITERAMNGELDFKQALKERVLCLKGLSFETAQKLLQEIPLTPGAEQLVKVLRLVGTKVGLVSGGFDFFVNHLKTQFQLDFAFANQLEVKDGKLTGEVTGTIVDAERKAQILDDMTHVFGVRHEQTVAIGDGANDILMLQKAGLGIAFKAKPKLQKVASLSLNQGGLESLLYLMGFAARDFQKL